MTLRIVGSSSIGGQFRLSSAYRYHLHESAACPEGDVTLAAAAPNSVIPPLDQRLRHGCGIRVFELAADRQAARDAADLEAARVEDF